MAKAQRELAGMERPKVKEIEDAAEDYVAIRDKRMSLTEKEVDARAVLLAAMEKHKLDAYRFDDRVVIVLPAKKVKVKTASDDEGDDEGDSD